jgi:hypothetical protein
LTNEEEYAEQIRNGPERLQQSSTYAKTAKHYLGVFKLSFLRFFICPDGTGMDSDDISMIEDWPALDSAQDVHVGLGFTIFYRQFIRVYVYVTMPISVLIMQAETSRMPTQPKWE